jgi:hypothetical protein
MWGQGAPGGGGGGEAVAAPPDGEGGVALPPLLQGSGAPRAGVRTRPAAPTTPAPVPLSRLIGNRDYFLIVECKADALVLQPWGTRFEIGKAAPPGQEHPLVQAIRRLVARRQATVRPDEPPYRPMIRFQVHPDGLHAYYFAYPLLEPLRYPMSRENLEK